MNGTYKLFVILTFESPLPILINTEVLIPGESAIIVVPPYAGLPPNSRPVCHPKESRVYVEYPLLYGDLTYIK